MDQLYYKWKRYDDEIDQLSKRIAAMDYDGITARENDQNRHHWGIETSDRYLLPHNSEWLTVDAILEPLPLVNFPIVPTPPPLPSNKHECSSWWFLQPDQNGTPRTLAKKETLQKLIAAKKATFEETFKIEAARLSEIRSRYLCEEPKALATLIEIANKRHSIPDRFQNSFHAFVDPEAKVVLIELQFPNFTKHKFEIDKTARGMPKYASEAQKKKIVRQCLYSVVIRAGHLGATVLRSTSYKTIAINVSQNWFDPATGVPRTGIICSLQAHVSELAELHLGRVDPEACFRHLKGIAVPSLDSISPVRPIFVLNKHDDRFIATREVDSLLEPESNLAAMPWDEFEHLIAQLFEWEFAKQGVEVRVTRVSRDRGVDAVLFDPDPLRGGKFVLQAKRYTNPVDVAAVRDLYGTVVNEGANRGILITTSSYGPDSYAFAKDKPISLVDGPNLLVMLRRHGKNFRIDLGEARLLNQANNDGR